MYSRFLSLSTSFKIHAFAGMVTIFLIWPSVLWLVPPSWMFSATVEVPDFEVGENPVVNYTREIAYTQTMDWSAEIRGVVPPPGNRQYCPGNGRSLYESDEEKIYPIKLLKFLGVSTCLPPPGNYFISVCWTGRIAWFPKVYCTRSNIFTII